MSEFRSYQFYGILKPLHKFVSVNSTRKKRINKTEVHSEAPGFWGSLRAILRDFSSVVIFPIAEKV